ncbi:MAG: Ig-like domain-containing protein, partial [Ignavibacteriales bacterium]
GGKTVSATYIGMQENFCLLFRYTIRPEDGVMGDLTVTDRIIASAGSIQDNENLEANLSLGNENTLIGTYVDGIAPEVHSMWQDGGPTSSIGAGFSEYIVAGPDINKITAKDNNGNPVQVRVCIDEEQWHLDVFAVDGWKKDMRYWISVPANAVLDRAGNSIANDLTLDWYTGYYTPTVYSSTPPENGNGVVRNPYITLRFTQNINRSWNYNVISVRDKSGIPVLLFSRIDGNLLILKPYYMLKKNTQYTVNIPAKAVIGSYANSPNDAYSFTFTTGS